MKKYTIFKALLFMAVLFLFCTCKAQTWPVPNLLVRGTIEAPALTMGVNDTSTYNFVAFNKSNNKLYRLWIQPQTNFYWSVYGNANTNPAVNFIGTTDNVPLSIRVNNIEYGRFEQDSANVFFGNLCGECNKGIENFANGTGTASYNIGNYGLFNGSGAGASNEGNNVILNGFDAGAYNTGDYLIASGTEAGRSNIGSKCIFLGDSAGLNNTIDNLLQIGEGDSATALIWGINRHGVGGARIHIGALPIIKQLSGKRNKI